MIDLLNISVQHTELCLTSLASLVLVWTFASPSVRCATSVYTVFMYSCIYSTPTVLCNICAIYVPGMFILATGYEKICLLACCRKRKKSISVH